MSRRRLHAGARHRFRLGARLLLGATCLLGCQRDREIQDAELQRRFSLGAVLGPDQGDEGFERALTARRFEFPEDHGPHPSFRNEWWYFTGNLKAENEKRFGYQLTLFRSALLRPDGNEARRSRWATTQVYMGHFALSQIDANKFVAFEKFERGALGLAGASANPLRIWIDDWYIQSTGADTFPIRLQARHPPFSIDLQLSTAKPVVLQGEGGLSLKGPTPGQASYYYSITRMPTRGSLQAGPQSIQVEGSSWMDREWSTSSLGEEQAGWDWFALQLSDGRELMYYQLRTRQGGVDPFSAGVLVSLSADVKRLAPKDISLTVTSHWRSPRDGTVYPAGWRLRLPAEDLDLTITPSIADQELNLTFRYWEGATNVTGIASGKAISGVGYVELTGYAATTRAPSP